MAGRYKSNSLLLCVGGWTQLRPTRVVTQAASPDDPDGEANSLSQTGGQSPDEARDPATRLNWSLCMIDKG